MKNTLIILIVITIFLTGCSSDTYTVSVSAYTLRREETDSTPCIGASNINLCTYNKPTVAMNGVPFGTLVIIKGEIYEVQDRMNKRYDSNHIDINFRHDLNGAIKFGRQNLKVTIIR